MELHRKPAPEVDSAVQSETNRNAKEALNRFSYNGTSYPIVTEVRCHVCTFGDRTQIEALLALGIGYREIARRFPSGPSSQSIRRHAIRDHVPVRSEIVRRLLEDAGGERAAVLKEGIATAVQRLSEATEIVAATNAGLMTGAVPVTLLQGIRAARSLLEYDLALGDARRVQGYLDDACNALNAVLDLVRATVPSTAWSNILQVMDRDPGLRPYLPPVRTA